MRSYETINNPNMTLPLPGKRPNFWLRLASNAWQSPQETIAQRERARRNTLTAWIVLGLLAMDLILIPAGLTDPTTLMAISVAALGIIVAGVLNRFGQTTAAGVLLIVLIIGAIIGAITGTPGGLPLVDLPAYDLLVIAIVVAASILSSGSAFIVAAVNIILIVLDFNLQSYAPDMKIQLAQIGALGMLARPVALQVIIATVAFLWVHGLQDQVRRADRAEEVAHLESIVADQKRALEYGVEQLSLAFVRSANGDYNVRVNIPQQNPLWSVGAQMNTFVQRLGAANQANFELERARQEAYRLAAALEDWRAGRPPLWPAPSGTLIDPLIQSVTGARPQSLDTGRQHPPSDGGLPFNWG
ncbi:MAG TPA: hypothetical protein VF808_03200 [Ktedonobacterales bacterium]